MFKFKAFATMKKNKKITDFLKINFILVIFFAIAYHLSDRFLYNYPVFSEKLGLGTIKQVDSIYSYIYFSLITQSGVGFGGILPDGGNVITTNSNIIKFLSLSQLSSVIYMLAWAL
jgi:hypothetical protein